jgi:replicative DNA helicase
LAKELNSVWVDLSQVNSTSRDIEHDRPKSRSLMWFNSIEPHADLIVFPWRPEVALAERKPAEPIPGNKAMEDAYATWKLRLDEARGKAEIVVAKNRHGESNVWEACGWDGATMQFTALRNSRQNDRYQGEF